MDELLEGAPDQIGRWRALLARHLRYLGQIDEDLQAVAQRLEDANCGFIDFADLQYALDWAVLNLRGLEGQQGRLLKETEPLLPALLRLSRRSRDLDLAWETKPGEPAAGPTVGRVEPGMAAMLDFGFRLFQALTTRSPDRNVFISPVGIVLALGMAANGARGATRRAAAEVLGIDLEDANAVGARLLAAAVRADDAVEMRIANSLWHRRDVQVVSGYAETLRAAYDATIRGLDYGDPAALGTVNGWVDRVTGGLISTVLGRLDPAVPVYLINAVAFRGTWTNTFDPAETEPAPFTRADGTRVPVPLMRQSGVYRYFENERFQLLRLPYGGEQIAMYVLLPEAGLGLAGLLAHLSSANWSDWLAALGEREGAIALPRFRAEYETSLLAALASTGPGAALADAEADFSGMVAGLRGPMLDAVHKAVVEVDEAGTRAAAATTFHIGGRPPAPFSMRAARPFCFALRHEGTGMLLFLGAIADPSEATHPAMSSPTG